MIGARLIEAEEQLWLDTGTTYIHGRNRFRVVAKEGRFLAIKVPGGKYWGGIAMPQNYAPAAFYVFEWHGGPGDSLDTAQWSQCLVILIRS